MSIAWADASSPPANCAAPESPAQLAFVIDEVRRRVQAAAAPVYLTIDIDCLDPAFAPGTGTPEPGGMTTAQVLTLLEELADLDFVGMDCVEVAPPYDVADLTANAASTFVCGTYLCRPPRTRRLSGGATCWRAKRR